ncbi:MAG TPA: 3'-5' exonuclease [Burkholderiaceae bacterium]|nr:3'-5' exonuclease [Burkholderiaceae bacterium]
MTLLRRRHADLVAVKALMRWLDRVRRTEANPYWDDLAVTIRELVESESGTKLPATMVIDALYDAASESVKSGNRDALKLMTAHGAKGLEFRHVIVMDCGDWGWSDEDRRLLYVAMTRAKETLTLFKVEDGRNRFLADVATLDGVANLLPPSRPRWRRDLEWRYITYGPGEVDIGYAGRCPASHPVHAAIRHLRVGSPVVIRQRRIETQDGQFVVGRLATATQDKLKDGTVGTVYGVMVRTRQQTPAAYLESVRVDEWEVPLVDVRTSG